MNYQINKSEMYNNLNVDWKNIPTIEMLEKDRQEATNSYNKQVTKIENWLKLLNPPQQDYGVGKTKIQPKLIRKQVEWRYASLEEPFLATEDLFTVRPITHLDVESARQNELIINKQFRIDINKVKFINKYIRTAITTGTVILKVGWEKEEAVVRQQIQEEVLLENPQEIQAYLMQQLQAGMIDEESANQILQSGQPIPIMQETIKNVKKTIKDSPVIEVKDARNCYIDPACDGDFDKVKYIIDKFSTNISALKKDGRFVNLDMIKIDDSDTDRYDDLIENKDDEFANYDDKARKKIDVYEYWGYWDISGKKELELIRVFYTKNVIIRAEKNPYPDKKMPYVLVKYLDVLNSLYGEPDAALLEDNQRIVSSITRGIIDLFAKSANGQRVFKKGVLDELNERRMKQGDDFSINEHVNNPNDAFFQFTYPNIPQSAFEFIKHIEMESEALSGSRPFNQSNGGQAINSTATEVRTALDATAKRDLNILRRLKSGLEEVGRKIIAMNSEFLPDETIVMITDEEDVAIKRDDLAGNFDLSVQISTPESDNQQASELAFMLQTLGPSEDPNLRKIILAEIADLRKMPHLAKQIREYEPQPDPLLQYERELNIKLLEAQITNEQAKAGENQVDIQLKQAKTLVEMAKAQLAKSNSDKLDLDWLEQALGLKQDRELEKISFADKMKNRL